MSDLLERIKSGEVLVCDGALGTMLIDRGFEPGICLESLNLTHPEILEEIAGLYLNAGADIIQTNTFGASPLKLSRFSLEGKAESINREAVRIVRGVVGNRAYVCGSCGPSGGLIIPYGELSPADVYNSFRKQAEFLIEAGVDLICVETMTDLHEARLAVRAARDVSSSVPIAATMTFDSTPRGFRTIMGVDIGKAAEELAQEGADLVGSNCGNGIEKMVQIAAEFKNHTQIPLIIQANAGIPELRKGRPVYRETPEFMAGWCGELLSLGVSVIGGCCGTTPDHIGAFRRIADQHNRSARIDK
jgi:5-methyltetrahydrofolate--homocysteine methyltransferase